ncbi:MAG TPA: radical SAM protein [Planctomycetota bacterium]|jgi:hypothetical protein
MARLEERDYTYFSTVRGMCRGCRETVPARVFFRDNKVWQQALCPDCRNEPALIAADKAWYLANVLQAFPDHAPLKHAHAPKHGCPHDCGPCTWHSSPCQLPVISVTNACNLRCPICFTYNRADKTFFMPVGEFQRTVAWVVESSGAVDLINVTGGEPTLHPQLLDLLACCKRPEIGRVTLNSNGIRLADDMDFCRRLAELGVCVVLSLHALDAETSIKIHGRDLVDVKLRAIDNLTRAGARMTLLNVMIRNTNETVCERLLQMMRQNDQILSLTIQTMTYTGQGGGGFTRGEHIPVDEAARIVSSSSKGTLTFNDFLSRPSAHPLCYLTCFLLKDGDRWLPLTRLAPRDQIAARMHDSYLLRLADGDDFFRSIIDQLYARGELDSLQAMRRFVERLFPADRALTAFERQRIAESAVRTVYIHAHMDEDTFDSARAMLCPDLVPAQPGRLIPACTYNLFYRQQDDRFYVNSECGGRA